MKKKNQSKKKWILNKNKDKYLNSTNFLPFNNLSKKKKLLKINQKSLFKNKNKINNKYRKNNLLSKSNVINLNNFFMNKKNNNKEFIGKSIEFKNGKSINNKTIKNESMIFQFKKKTSPKQLIRSKLKGIINKNDKSTIKKYFSHKKIDQKSKINIGFKNIFKNIKNTSNKNYKSQLIDLNLNKEKEKIKNREKNINYFSNNKKNKNELDNLKKRLNEFFDQFNELKKLN